MDYYDRQGQPITMDEWGRLIGDLEYKIIRQTPLFDGTFISTVWLGIDYGFGYGPPLIFETMVFPNDGLGLEQECRRHPTEAAALAWHDQTIAKITEALERLRDAVDGT